MKLSLVRSLAVMVLSSGAVVVALAWAGLLVALGQTDGLARYPGAERLGAVQPRLGTVLKGYVSQHGVYQTTDNAREVFGWYVRQLGAGRADPQSAMGGCQTWGKVDGHLFLQGSLAITLCPQPAGTLIFVNRNLAVRW